MTSYFPSLIYKSILDYISFSSTHKTIITQRSHNVATLLASSRSFCSSSFGPVLVENLEMNEDSCGGVEIDRTIKIFQMLQTTTTTSKSKTDLQQSQNLRNTLELTRSISYQFTRDFYAPTSRRADPKLFFISIPPTTSSFCVKSLTNLNLENITYDCLHPITKNNNNRNLIFYSLQKLSLLMKPVIVDVQEEEEALSKSHAIEFQESIFALLCPQAKFKKADASSSVNLPSLIELSLTGLTLDRSACLSVESYATLSGKIKEQDAMIADLLWKCISNCLNGGNSPKLQRLVIGCESVPEQSVGSDSFCLEFCNNGLAVNIEQVKSLKSLKFINFHFTETDFSAIKKACTITITESSEEDEQQQQQYINFEYSSSHSPASSAFYQDHLFLLNQQNPSEETTKKNILRISSLEFDYEYLLHYRRVDAVVKENPSFFKYIKTFVVKDPQNLFFPTLAFPLKFTTSTSSDDAIENENDFFSKFEHLETFTHLLNDPTEKNPTYQVRTDIMSCYHIDSMIHRSPTMKFTLKHLHLASAFFFGDDQTVANKGLMLLTEFVNLESLTLWCAPSIRKACMNDHIPTIRSIFSKFSKKLSHLDLTGSDVGDAVVKHGIVEYLHNLTSLSLGKNENISDTVFTSSKEKQEDVAFQSKKKVFGRNIKYLNFHRCPSLTDQTWSEIIDMCPKLEEIDLGKTKRLSNATVKKFFQQTSLMKIHLVAMNGVGPQVKRDLKKDFSTFEICE